MADVTYIKRTNGEAVVKVVATSSGDATIDLVDLTNTDVEAAVGDYMVNIIEASWSGVSGANILVQRDGYNVLETAASPAGEVNYYALATVDSTNNDQSIYVQFSDAGQITLKLRKVSGWDKTFEPETYGAYDDETIVGPLTIPGAPPPAGLFDLPAPGSGTYQDTLTVDTSEAGTPYPPGGDLTSISNETAGLYRKKFKGNFAPDVGDSIDVEFCRNTPSYFGQADTYIGFGNQNLETENYYTLEWTGYFKAPSTGSYNFWVKSDDDTYFWIGPSAEDGNNSDSNFVVSSSNSENKTADSLQLTAGKYYPVRIQFGEWGGSEYMQLFWALEGDDYAWGGTESDGVWFHDSVAKGIAA